MPRAGRIVVSQSWPIVRVGCLPRPEPTGAGAVGASGLAAGSRPRAALRRHGQEPPLAVLVDQPVAVVRRLRHERAVRHGARPEDDARRRRLLPADVDAVDTELVGHHLGLERPAEDAAAAEQPLPAAVLVDERLEVVPEERLVLEAALHARGVVRLGDDRRRGDRDPRDERNAGGDRSRARRTEDASSRPLDALQQAHCSDAAEDRDRRGGDHQVALVAREARLGHRGHEREPREAEDRERQHGALGPSSPPGDTPPRPRSASPARPGRSCSPRSA